MSLYGRRCTRFQANRHHQPTPLAQLSQRHIGSHRRIESGPTDPMALVDAGLMVIIVANFLRGAARVPSSIGPHPPRILDPV